MTSQQFDRRRPPERGQPPPSRRAGQQSPASLPADYLKSGYFDSNGNVRPELITSLAEEVARTLTQNASPPMASTQLRRFYNKARSFKDLLDAGASFPSIVSRIRELERDAVYSVGRELAPPVFKEFMERNVRLAEKGRKEFESGFLQHFQSVVAYSKYIEFISGRK